MKAPVSWLREYVSIDASMDELASRLALTGTEVERVAEVGMPLANDNLLLFVVGKVLDCARHPNADKLSVCTVDVGEAEPRTIVCGAPNVAAGQTVPVVLPGALMPGGFLIKEARLRGVQSLGMIMSEAELGLAAKSSGILTLPDEWRAGDLLNDHFAVGDSVLEVEVTPNRPDCLSVRGLAREIGAVMGASFEEDLEISHPWGDRPIDADVSIEVQDPGLCPRYAARVVRGVVVAESPLWLKARIAHAGMRPVNNVVDVTNYVLWALGQPLHAFDLRTIRGGRLIVRRALAGEKIATLDGEERILSDDMLVIADAERPSVIAGIMGGVESEVTETTTDVLIECATFSGPSIMRTSGALGLRTEASTRYEKGLDPGLVPLALDMACSLMVSICGGEVSVGTIDVRFDIEREMTITLRSSRMTQVLGYSIPIEAAAEFLGRLGCGVSILDGDLEVRVPSFRADLEREIDLVEEVVRIFGLDRIPSTLPARKEGGGHLTRGQRLTRRVEDLLAGSGLAQAITYSFGDQAWPKRLRLPDEDGRRDQIAITNPLSAEQSVMRTMLLPGLLDAARRNVAVRQDRVGLFEIGRTFEKAKTLSHERSRLGLLISGVWEEPHWLSTGVGIDFYLAKGLIERLAADLGCQLRFARGSEPFLHPGKTALVSTQADARLGWVGEVHPLVLQAYDLKGPAVAAELDLDLLLEAVPDVSLFRDLLAFPVVEQDMALVVDSAVPAAQVVDALRLAGGTLLESISVFDVYEGSQVHPGKKSLAIRMSFRAADRTLSDSEVNELRDIMLAEVGTSLGAQLRT